MRADDENSGLNRRRGRFSWRPTIVLAGSSLVISLTNDIDSPGWNLIPHIALCTNLLTTIFAVSIITERLISRRLKEISSQVVALLFLWGANMIATPILFTKVTIQLSIDSEHYRRCGDSARSVIPGPYISICDRSSHGTYSESVIIYDESDEIISPDLPKTPGWRNAYKKLKLPELNYIDSIWRISGHFYFISFTYGLGSFNL